MIKEAKAGVATVAVTVAAGAANHRETAVAEVAVVETRVAIVGLISLAKAK